MIPAEVAMDYHRRLCGTRDEKRVSSAHAAGVTLCSAPALPVADPVFSTADQATASRSFSRSHYLFVCPKHLSRSSVCLRTSSTSSPSHRMRIDGRLSFDRHRDLLRLSAADCGSSLDATARSTHSSIASLFTATPLALHPLSR